MVRTDPQFSPRAALLRRVQGVTVVFGVFLGRKHPPSSSDAQAVGDQRPRFFCGRPLWYVCCWQMPCFWRPLFLLFIGVMKLLAFDPAPSGDRSMTQNALMTALRTMDVGRVQMTANNWCQTFEEHQAGSISIAGPCGPATSHEVHKCLNYNYLCRTGVLTRSIPTR